jgi:NADPH-dependent curcumin reductase CurA
MTNPHLPTSARSWHLSSRPQGWPTPGNFALRGQDLPTLRDGQILVRNEYFSVDPYMRRRMNDEPSYVAPFALDEPMDGRAAGVVVAATSPDFAVGDHVLHMLGWRDYAVVDASAATSVDANIAPLSAYLGLLGNAGLTAYAGLLRVAEMKQGDVVFVSGAAGAVGSAVGQMAKIMGAGQVIGSTSTPEKADLLTRQFGFDAALDYRSRPIADQLREAAPDGIDVYFDNVGGDHLEAALDSLRLHGRVVLCGMIGDYNATGTATAPRNLIQAINKRIRLEGMLVGDHADITEHFIKQAGLWLEDGRLQHSETVVTGLENGAEAFLGLMRGDNVGKMIVKVSG